MHQTIRRHIRIPKQKSIPWLGAIIDSLYISLPMVSVVNFISIQTLLYANVKEYILPWAPWISFPLFILFMVCFVCVVMLFAFKFMIPSLWVWRGKQLYGHQSILMDEVKEARDDIKELENKMVGEIDTLKTQIESLKGDVKNDIEDIKKEMLASKS